MSKLISIAVTVVIGALLAVVAYYVAPSFSTEVGGLVGLIFLSFHLGKFAFNLMHDDNNIKQTK